MVANTEPDRVQVMGSLNLQKELRYIETRPGDQEPEAKTVPKENRTGASN